MHVTVDQVPDLQAKWQDLFQRRSACTSLAEFHMKKTLLSDILDGQSRRLDQADALTGVEDELQEEIERLEVGDLYILKVNLSLLTVNLLFSQLLLILCMQYR